MTLSKIDRTIVITGAIAGLLAVVLGAFGAHGLKSLVSPESITSYTTGVRYQMYHAIVCLILGGTAIVPPKVKKRILCCFLMGMFLFCGSIYLLVIDEVLGFDASPIGFITPLGGLLLIVGWALLIVSVLKKQS